MTTNPCINCPSFIFCTTGCWPDITRTCKRCHTIKPEGGAFGDTAVICNRASYHAEWHSVCGNCDRKARGMHMWGYRGYLPEEDEK